jgi:hypothetical protein
MLIQINLLKKEKYSIYNYKTQKEEEEEIYYNGIIIYYI